EQPVPFCCGILCLLFATSILGGPNPSIAQALLRSRPVNVTVTISPPEAILFASETQVFVATVVGETHRTVTWSVTEADGGTVEPRTLYRTENPGCVSRHRNQRGQPPEASGGNGYGPCLLRPARHLI